MSKIARRTAATLCFLITAQLHWMPITAQSISALTPLNQVNAGPQNESSTNSATVGTLESRLLPPNPADTKGYTVNFTWNKQVSSGYLMVNVLVTSTSTFAADHRITLRLEPVELGHSPSQNGMTIDIPISIDQGSKQKSVTRLLPKWSTGNGYKLRVFDDGAERKDYAIEIGELLRNQNRANMDALTVDFKNDWLIVCQDDQNPAVRSFVQGTYPVTVSQSNGFSSQTGPSRVTRATIAPGDLPTDWRGLQSYDAVVIRQSLLEELSIELPVKFSVLRDWVFCGGTVVVFDATSMQSVTESIDVAYSPDAQSDWIVKTQANTIGSNHRASMYALQDSIKAIETEQKAMQNPQLNNTYGMSSNLTTQQMDAELKKQRVRMGVLQKDRPSMLLGQQVWLQRAGGGQLIGIDKANKLDQFSLSVVARTFGYRQSPMLRRGVDPLIGDQRVRRWLIPGVAQPPVYTFMALLTLFVVLVGPVAYRKTTKSGRGYLMFAIAPVLAFLTTAMMLIYGVVADGFGTQTRVRQLTWVDGASGDAGERIRGTYFSGVRPIDGLSFDADAEVMVYPDFNNESWEALNQMETSSMGVVTVSDQRQRFDSSYLPSRAQKQFVVHRPRHKIGRLRLGPPRSTGQTPTFSSEFDFALQHIIVRDRGGEYWWLENLEANAKDVACNRATPNTASEMLGTLYNEHRPIAATRESSNSSRNYRNRTRDLISLANRRTGDQSRMVTDGVFEFWLQQNMQVDGELPNGYFMALADVTDDSIWVKEAEKVDSVRFVYGTLP